MHFWVWQFYSWLPDLSLVQTEFSLFSSTYRIYLESPLKLCSTFFEPTVVFATSASLAQWNHKNVSISHLLLQFRSCGSEKRLCCFLIVLLPPASRDAKQPRVLCKGFLLWGTIWIHVHEWDTHVCNMTNAKTLQETRYWNLHVNILCLSLLAANTILGGDGHVIERPDRIWCGNRCFIFLN